MKKKNFLFLLVPTNLLVRLRVYLNFECNLNFIGDTKKSFSELVSGGFRTCNFQSVLERTEILN